MIIYEELIDSDRPISEHLKTKSLELISKSDNTVAMLFNLAKRDSSIISCDKLARLISHQKVEDINTYLSTYNATSRKMEYAIECIPHFILMSESNSRITVVESNELKVINESTLDDTDRRLLSEIANIYSSDFDLLPLELKEIEMDFVSNWVITLVITGIYPYSLFSSDVEEIDNQEYEKSIIPIQLLGVEDLKHNTTTMNNWREWNFAVGGFKQGTSVTPKEIIFSVNRGMNPDGMITKLELREISESTVYSALCYRDIKDIATSRLMAWKTMGNLTHTDLNESSVDLIEMELRKFNWYQFSCDEEKWFPSYPTGWGLLGINEQEGKFSIYMYQ